MVSSALKKSSILISAFALVAVIYLSSCQIKPAIVGVWQDQGPAAIRYEFRNNGKVYMLMHDRAYFYFQYQLQDNSILRLYDGMGRRIDYRYEIEGDRMVFYAPPDSNHVKMVLLRTSGDGEE